MRFCRPRISPIQGIEPIPGMAIPVKVSPFWPGQVQRVERPGETEGEDVEHQAGDDLVGAPVHVEKGEESAEHNPATTAARIPSVALPRVIPM